MGDTKDDLLATRMSTGRLTYYVLSAANRALKLILRVLSGVTNPLSRIVARIDLVRLGHLRFAARPDDIFIVTYPRSGTTLMQMILYQLSTDGGMDFFHISEYCPWFERVIRNGGDLEALSSPRVFKSHLPYRWIPKGPCKYIYVARNGRDVAVSYFHLYKSHNGYEGTFSEFFDRFMCGKVTYGSWFDHVAEWWSHRGDLQVLFLTYEELQDDLESCIHKVADFCGLAIDPERLPTILERCSFAFMKQYETKFDQQTQLLRERGVKEWGFIRKGQVGEGKEYLSPEQEMRFERELRKRLGDSGLSVTFDYLA